MAATGEPQQSGGLGRGQRLDPARHRPVVRRDQEQRLPGGLGQGIEVGGEDPYQAVGGRQELPVGRVGRVRAAGAVRPGQFDQCQRVPGGLVEDAQ